MGLLGGGRNDVIVRFLRYYNIIGMNLFSEEIMIKIFFIFLIIYLRVSLKWLFFYLILKISVEILKYVKKNLIY